MKDVGGVKEEGPTVNQKLKQGIKVYVGLRGKKRSMLGMRSEVEQGHKDGENQDDQVREGVSVHQSG